MPVIRKPVEPSSPDLDQAGRPIQGSRAPARETAPPARETAAPARDTPAPPREPAAPAPDLTPALDRLAATLQEHIAHYHDLTQARTVRGLEAVDRRAMERQRAIDGALNDGLQSVAAELRNLRAEIREATAASRRQTDDLSGHVYTALAGILDVLRQMKSETVVLRNSVDAIDLELRMRRGEPGGGGPG